MATVAARSRELTLGSGRRCDRCGVGLTGKRGHGFPSRDGRKIECGNCYMLAPAPRIHVP